MIYEEMITLKKVSHWRCVISKHKTLVDNLGEVLHCGFFLRICFNFMQGILLSRKY